MSILRNPKDRITICYLLVLAAGKLSLPFIIGNINIALIVLLGFMTFVILSLQHNIAHHPIFHNRIANQLLTHFITLLTGVSSRGLEIIHIQNHHAHIDDDNDWGRTSRYQYRSEGVNYLLYILNTPFLFLWHMKANRNSVRDHRIDSENSLMISLILVCTLLNWKYTLAYFVIPYTIGQLLLVSFNYFQHRACNPENIYESSRNFTGKWINTITMNNGYHTAHHLHPHKHWSEYAHIHCRISSQIPAELNQANFFVYFWKEIVLKRRNMEIESRI